MIVIANKNLRDSSKRDKGKKQYEKEKKTCEGYFTEWKYFCEKKLRQFSNLYQDSSTLNAACYFV